ncbi:MAG TPA: cupin domain-containing protein [Allosphingosinicella sp.]|jgi:quercetin dioxygenase-like cupin family protein
MRLFAAAALPLSLLACAGEQPQAEQAQPQANSLQGRAEEMEISRGASRPAGPGPADYFTGRVTIAPLFEANGSSQVGAALVTFASGARTAWHMHPMGQRLVVVSGTGWTQVEGGEVETFRAGDVVWCPPNLRHWHGATPTGAMSHIAIQESRNGSPVTWMEHVTDEQYGQRGAAR